MFCAKCKEDLGDCKCPDLQERLQGLGGTVIYRKCMKCEQHYSRCKCEEPVWGTNKTNKIIVKVQLAFNGDSVLIYDKERKHQGEMAVSGPVRELMGDSMKKFFYALAGKDGIAVLSEAPWQEW